MEPRPKEPKAVSKWHGRLKKRFVHKEIFAHGKATVPGLALAHALLSGQEGTRFGRPDLPQSAADDCNW